MVCVRSGQTVLVKAVLVKACVKTTFTQQDRHSRSYIPWEEVHSCGLTVILATEDAQDTSTLAGGARSRPLCCQGAELRVEGYGSCCVVKFTHREKVEREQVLGFHHRVVRGDAARGSTSPHSSSSPRPRVLNRVEGRAPIPQTLPNLRTTIFLLALRSMTRPSAEPRSFVSVVLHQVHDVSALEGCVRTSLS